MSMVLNNGSHPYCLTAKTSGIGPPVVDLGDYEIYLKDFCTLVLYVVKSVAPQKQPTRVRWLATFLRAAGKNMNIIPGYNADRRNNAVRLERCSGEGIVKAPRPQGCLLWPDTSRALELSKKTTPKGMTASVTEKGIHLGEYTITFPDFLVLVTYVLTNADLCKEDPRLPLVRTLKAVRVATSKKTGSIQFRLPPDPKKRR